MKISSAVRTALVALVAAASASSVGYADNGYVRLTNDMHYPRTWMSTSRCAR